MSTCFVYGTLMAEAVFSRVVFGSTALESNQDVYYTDGTLKDHKRYMLKDRDYPGVMACAGAEVQGKLVHNVDKLAMIKLDHFEGDEYERQQVTVTSDKGEQVQAYIYLWLDKSLVIDKEWNYDDFVKVKMHKWIAEELAEQDGLGGRFWADSVKA